MFLDWSCINLTQPELHSSSEFKIQVGFGFTCLQFKRILGCALPELAFSSCNPSLMQENGVRIIGAFYFPRCVCVTQEFHYREENYFDFPYGPLILVSCDIFFLRISISHNKDRNAQFLFSVKKLNHRKRNSFVAQISP